MGAYISLEDFDDMEATFVRRKNKIKLNLFNFYFLTFILTWILYRVISYHTL